MDFLPKREREKMRERQRERESTGREGGLGGTTGPLQDRTGLSEVIIYDHLFLTQVGLNVSVVARATQSGSERVKTSNLKRVSRLSGPT